MLEFPPSMSHREVAKLLQTEGWFSPKTTVYYIEYRVTRVREKRSVLWTGSSADE
jgi:hypothetical protein